MTAMAFSYGTQLPKSLRLVTSNPTTFIINTTTCIGRLTRAQGEKRREGYWVGQASRVVCEYGTVTSVYIRNDIERSFY